MTLFGMFEKRASMENPAVPLTDAGLLSWLNGPPTDAGIPVNEVTAMNFSAVYRCVSLIAGIGGAMPLQVMDEETQEPVDNPLIKDPHPEMTALEYYRTTYVDRSLWGNHFSQKVRTRSGRIDFLKPIRPNRVQVDYVPPSPSNRTGKIYRVVDDDGVSRTMGPDDILHLPHLGLDGSSGVSPIRLAAQSIGLALGAEKYAALLFGSGNLTSGILQTDKTLTQADAERLQERWQQKMGGLQRAHRVAILDQGATFQSLTMPNDDAQLLESRRFQLTELGRFFGVPPFLLFDHEKSTTWGTGLEQQALGFVNYDLRTAWLDPTAARITKELLEDGVVARYDLTDLLRGDSIARAEFYRVMREVGALSANDIRAREGLPPVDGGDTYLEPASMSTTGDAPMGTDKVLGGASMGPPDA